MCKYGDSAERRAGVKGGGDWGKGFRKRGHTGFGSRGDAGSQQDPFTED